MNDPTLKELQLLETTWAYIVANKIFSKAYLPDEISIELRPYRFNCPYCKYYCDINCERCPLVIKNNHGCGTSGHPYNDWWFHEKIESAKWILEKIRADIKRRSK